MAKIQDEAALEDQYHYEPLSLMDRTSGQPSSATEKASESPPISMQPFVASDRTGGISSATSMFTMVGFILSVSNTDSTMALFCYRFGSTRYV